MTQQRRNSKTMKKLKAITFSWRGQLLGLQNNRLPKTEKLLEITSCLQGKKEIGIKSLSVNNNYPPEND